MNSLCEKCHLKYRCALNFDGEPCKENRDVEPTYLDYFKDRTDYCKDAEKLADFLTQFLIDQDINSLVNEDSVLEKLISYFTKEVL